MPSPGFLGKCYFSSRQPQEHFIIKSQHCKIYIGKKCFARAMWHTHDLQLKWRVDLWLLSCQQQPARKIDFHKELVSPPSLVRAWAPMRVFEVRKNRRQLRPYLLRRRKRSRGGRRDAEATQITGPSRRFIAGTSLTFHGPPRGCPPPRCP